MRFLSALAGRLRQSARRIVIRVALAFAGALSGLAGVAFATYALFEAWRLQYGVVIASIGLSVIYLFLAAVLFLCLRLVGSPRSAPATPGSGEGAANDGAPVKSPTSASGGSEAVALALGVEIAKQLTPLQLTMVAALSGFIAGRKL